MNKRDLIDAISGRLGDKKTATEAVNAVLDTIQHAVAKGDKVAITGFGVFEKTDRPARTAQEPSHRRVHQGAQVLGAQVPGRRRLQGPGQRRQEEGRRGPEVARRARTDGGRP